MSSMFINDLKNQLNVINDSMGSNTLPVPQAYKVYTTLNRDNLAVMVGSIFER